MLTASSLEERLKSNSYRLLGQIKISDEEYEELRKYAMMSVSHLTSHIFVDIKLSVFMVQVAIREYKEGKYWPCFQDIIECDLPSNKQNTLGKVFLMTIQNYNLLVLENTGIQVYVENIKAHAFVTNWYLDGFFDFSDAYYDNNLDGVIDEDIEDDFFDLSSFMRTTLNIDADTISEKGSGKHAARSYRLLKSTRAVFSQAGPELLKDVFLPTLKMIDKAHYDGVVPQGWDRFEKAYIDWYQRRIEADKRKNITRGAGGQKFYSRRPYIIANLRSRGFELVIPKQKFRDDDCAGHASIYISYNNHNLEHELELYRSFGIYMSEEIRIPIDEIFCQFKISIVSEVIREYVIPAAIYRLFNGSWQQIKKLEEGHDHLLVLPGNEVSFQGEHSIIDRYEDKRWVHYDVNVSKEAVCFLNSLMLSTIGEFATEPIFERAITNYTVISDDNRVIQATRRHPTVSFFVREEKYRGTVICINKNRYAVRNLKDVSVVKWPKDENTVAVTVRLDESDIDRSDGHYLITLDVPGESNKTLAEYILLKHVHFYLTGTIYIFAKTGSFVLNPDGHDFIIDPSWDDKSFPDGSEKYYFPLSTDMEYIDIGLALGGRIFTLRNQIRTFAYGFSKENLVSELSGNIWYKDLRESLYLRLPGATNVLAYLQDQMNNKKKAEDLGNGIFRVDISSLVYTINHEKNRNLLTLSIDFFTHRKQWVNLPIQRRTYITPYFILNYSEEEGVYTDISIVGKADILLTVKDHVSHEIVIDRKKMANGFNKLDGLTPEGYYDFEPIMVESDDFFAIDEEPLRIIKGHGVVQITDLTHCRLPVDEIVFKGKEMHLGKGKYFLYVQQKTDHNSYIGTLRYNVRRPDTGAWETTFCGKAKAKMHLGSQHMTATILIYSNNDGMWMAPYFDMKTKGILSSDTDAIQHSREYGRYALLDENETEYLIDIPHIRRFK